MSASLLRAASSEPRDSSIQIFIYDLYFLFLAAWPPDVDFHLSMLGMSHSLCRYHFDKPRCSRLNRVNGDLHVILGKKFDQIQISFRYYDLYELGGMIASADLLPVVSDLINGTVELTG